MSPAEARAVLRALDHLRNHEGLDHIEIALMADAKRALSIPTTLKETLKTTTYSGRK